MEKSLHMKLIFNVERPSVFIITPDADVISVGAHLPCHLGSTSWNSTFKDTKT